MHGADQRDSPDGHGAARQRQERRTRVEQQEAESKNRGTPDAARRMDLQEDSHVRKEKSDQQDVPDHGNKSARISREEHARVCNKGQDENMAQGDSQERKRDGHGTETVIRHSTRAAVEGHDSAEEGIGEKEGKRERMPGLGDQLAQARRPRHRERQHNPAPEDQRCVERGAVIAEQRSMQPH